jgi:hypothetical protein
MFESTRHHVQFQGLFNDLHARHVNPVCEDCMEMFPAHPHPFIFVLGGMTKFACCDCEESLLEDAGIPFLFEVGSMVAS